MIINGCQTKKERGVREMKICKPIGYALSFFLWITGCASASSTQRGIEPQTVIIERESQEKMEELKESIRRLEASLYTLRSEIAFLEKDLRNIPTRPPLSSYKLPKEVVLCGERIPLEDRAIWENLDREFLIAMDQHAQIFLWMKRVRRYFPHIEKRLKEMNLPDDLKYVAITESGLRPHAVSSSGAAGLWQFIPSTGETYGMRKGRGLDERFDFMKATEGALNYLKNLYEEFGSWTLAMAAYHAGENRVRREIEVQGTRNYFHLDLPIETERYVYKIAVAKIILSDPKRYGFQLEDEASYDPFLWERVRIELKRPLPLMDVARAIGCYYKEIKEMNLHLTEEVLPAGTQFLNLPRGRAEPFWDFFARWQKEWESDSLRPKP